MITLANLKHDLNATKDLGDIIDVLKVASILQFHLIQSRDKPNEIFRKEMESSLNLLCSYDSSDPYFTGIMNLPSAIIVVTSDEGFLGELNTVLVNRALEEKVSAKDEIVVLGERGIRYLEDAGISFFSFPGISDDIDYAETERLSDHLFRPYARQFGRILAVYPKFVSLTYQKTEILQILPYGPKLEGDDEGRMRQKILFEDMAMEPSYGRVLRMLAELWMRFNLYEVFWSSKQSEYAARIMHLEGSTEELRSLNRNLELAYFRQIHALRDKSIREISASKVLLEKKRN